MQATTDLTEHFRQVAAEATEVARRITEAKARAINQNWYIAHAGASEKRTVDEFERSGIEYYYPQTWGSERVPKRELTASNRGRNVMRPVKVALWKGYFFVRVDLAGGLWREPFERAAVFGMMANNEGGRLLPAPVQPVVVENIRRLEVNGVVPPLVKARELLFVVGEGVRITEGPFVGFDGVIHDEVEKPINALDDSVKAKLLVNIFGRMCIVEVPIGDFEKL